MQRKDKAMQSPFLYFTAVVYVDVSAVCCARVSILVHMWDDQGTIPNRQNLRYHWWHLQGLASCQQSMDMSTVPVQPMSTTERPAMLSMPACGPASPNPAATLPLHQLLSNKGGS
jgi:hypothetical protein